MNSKELKLAIFIITMTILGIFIIKFNIKNYQDSIKKEINDNVLSVSKETTDGIFSAYYKQALEKMKSMTIDEKIKQLLLVRYNDKVIDGVSGYIFFESDFKDKDTNEVINMINNLQSKANIPLLTAVDEEGGRVVRISSNSSLRSEKFKSPKELYETGGFTAIKNDVQEKSKLLKKLGINLNLAPVVDISDDDTSYMYDRTIGYGVDITSEYAKNVIQASKGTDVSYTLKHFPGYGNNGDTHTSSETDNRSCDTIKANDLIPFKEGINAGAEAVLVSHNIIECLDDKNPASLSKSVHELLSKDLNFTGVTMTDNLDMGATENIEFKYLNALLAGNELLIVDYFDDAFNEIKTGLNNNKITEGEINDKVMKILAWKYYKLLITDYIK